MGAPATTAPGTPAGVKLDDGFASCFAFALLPSVSLWETETQMPGLDGGDAIDTTTHRSKKVRQRTPRKLFDVTETTHTCRYNKSTYDQIKNTLLNKNGSITQHFPDGVPTDTESGLGLGSSLSYFGYISKIDPKAFKEGEPPEIEITIVPTNTDPSDGSEAVPVFNAI